MIIYKENKQPIYEVVQAVGNQEYHALLSQMQQNLILDQTLNTPMNEISQYQFLTDDPIFKNATLLEIIVGTLKRSSKGFESYFVKTPRGLIVGFLALHIVIEDGKPVIDDVKTFSFGLTDPDDENQMFKDLPAFLDKCLAKYGKVSWTALVGNKANRAYEIYTKRRKGVISKEGKYIRYICRQT
jgi:hypothetical protein